MPLLERLLRYLKAALIVSDRGGGSDCPDGGDVHRTSPVPSPCTRDEPVDPRGLPPPGSRRTQMEVSQFGDRGGAR